MDLLFEAKSVCETESNEECSDNFIMDIQPAFEESEETTGISRNIKDLESSFLDKNVKNGKCCYDSIYLGHESQVKENKIDVLENPKRGNKSANETKYFESDFKKEVLAEKNEVEKKNDFQQDNKARLMNNQDISRDGSIISSCSSGIEKDIELLKDPVEVVTEMKDKLDNYFKDLSAVSLHDAEYSNHDMGTSIKIKDELSEIISSEGKLKLTDKEENLKKDDSAVISCNDVSYFDAITFPYKNPSNAFDVVVPLIGKNIIAVSDAKPWKHRYDLAKEINRLKGLEDASSMPKLSYHDWRKQRDDKPQEEKDREERSEKVIALKTAGYIIKIAVNILEEMQKDHPEENIIERLFLRFLQIPASPLSLLLSTQFVHVMMYIRGSSDFSQNLRNVADRCYMKCHVMFPIPEGYNFETVYTSEVVKNIPEQLNGMHNFILDYEDFENPVIEKDDSAFSDDK